MTRRTIAGAFLPARSASLPVAVACTGAALLSTMQCDISPPLAPSASSGVAMMKTLTIPQGLNARGGEGWFYPS
jgi:hypothetical protein